MAQSLPCRAAETQYGIAYFLWHCLAKGRPIYDISQEQKLGLPPGPVPEFHWWGKPADGYYCLSERDDILRQHAELLAKAGIDFVFIGFTNHDSMRYSRVHLEYLDPLAHLLAVWSTIPGAPKVVPVVPVTRNGDLYAEIARRLLAYPQLLFNFKGKPLFLITDNSIFHVDREKRAMLERTFTTRLMWADHSPPGSWMFLSRCAPGFLASKGQARCNQRVAYHDGAVEQVSVAAAFQYTYISDPRTAVPRFHGVTFLRQMARIDDFPHVPIVTVLGWNQWMAQRHCLKSWLLSELRCRLGFSDRVAGNYIFTDEFNQEYSNDFEPGGDMGDAYYRLLSCEIHRRKAGSSLACPLPLGKSPISRSN